MMHSLNFAVNNHTKGISTLISTTPLQTITSFCRHFTYIESCEMKHEMTQWKCFVPDTPSFCDYIWSHVEFFSETFHIRWRWFIWKSPITTHSLYIYLVMGQFNYAHTIRHPAGCSVNSNWIWTFQLNSDSVLPWTWLNQLLILFSWEKEVNCPSN